MMQNEVALGLVRKAQIAHGADQRFLFFWVQDGAHQRRDESIYIQFYRGRYIYFQIKYSIASVMRYFWRCHRVVRRTRKQLMCVT